MELASAKLASNPGVLPVKNRSVMQVAFDSTSSLSNFIERQSRVTELVH